MLPPKMIYDIVARTNWLNIKSNYFVNTIAIFNLSNYTDITITVTFVEALAYHTAGNVLHLFDLLFGSNCGCKNKCKLVALIGTGEIVYI